MLTEYQTAAHSPQRFVRRDRIQAALSLAVIPIQCDIKSGTMHTVRYAKQYGRAALCLLLDSMMGEHHLMQYRGLLALNEQEGSFRTQANSSLR